MPVEGEEEARGNGGGEGDGERTWRGGQQGRTGGVISGDAYVSSSERKLAQDVE
jgi:hypothetical protein